MYIAVFAVVIIIARNFDTSCITGVVLSVILAVFNVAYNAVNFVV